MKLWGNNGLFNWWSLRPVGNLFILKVSYPVLFLVPFLSRYEDIARTLGLLNWIVLVSFFASLALALANLLYDIFCPVLIKRFDSPNTLYKEMLSIDMMSKECRPQDNFDASLAHCKAAYNSFSESKPFAGILCATLYVAALALFATILIERVFVVVKSVVKSLCHNIAEVSTVVQWTIEPHPLIGI